MKIECWNINQSSEGRTEFSFVTYDKIDRDTFLDLIRLYDKSTAVPNDDTETTGDSAKKFVESLVKSGHVVDFSHITPIGNLFIPSPQEEMKVGPEPDIRYFHITDVSNILGNGMGSKYPLFVKDGNNSHQFIINYAIMKEFLYRDDVKIRISFALKEGGGGACAVFKPSDVMVHVGGTTITGENEDGTVVEIRARNWKKLCSARVTIRKISESEE